MFKRKTKTLKIETGNLPIELPDGSTWHADLVLYQIVAEELQAKHNLADDGKQWVATEDFLNDLAAQYKQLGAPESIDATAARFIWIAIAAKFAEFEARFNARLQNLA